jgi:hypothetical protein
MTSLSIRILTFPLLPLMLSVEAGTIDWTILESDDTLALFMNGQDAGTLIQSTNVDRDSASIRIDRRIHLGKGDGNTPAMELVEQRRYGSDGMLRSARQEITSASGSSLWDLRPDEKTGWRLLVTTGGIQRTVPVGRITESLHEMWSVQNGVRNRTIKAGTVFNDTVFDLTSAQSITTAIRCSETPAKTNGFTWRFICRNNVLDRDEAWQLDSTGATLYQEIFPFVVRKTAAAGTEKKRDSAFTLMSLVEAMAVPAGRGANSDECIRLSLTGAAAPDSSVRWFYSKQENDWLLTGIPQTCARLPSKGRKDPDLERFTAATSTMQSSDPRIRRKADSLCEKRSDRCDSIQACYGYVFRTLAKRYAPTFSNAIETFEAGYGDCGEHAVFLGALLRSVGIPARVVLGLVFNPGKNGYYYHAWVMAESHGAWVFADPTLGEFPAGKDRIPLVIDDTGREVMQIAKVIGKIRVGYEKNAVKTTQHEDK